MITLLVTIFLSVVLGVIREFKGKKNPDPMMIGVVVCVYVVVGTVLGLVIYAVGGLIFPGCVNLFCGPLPLGS